MVALGLGELAVAVLLAALFAVPLAVTLWAVLDAARRPRWAWALAGRRQVVWMAGIMFAALTVVGGLCVSAWYLLRIRPTIAAAEWGDPDALAPPGRRRAGGDPGPHGSPPEDPDGDGGTTGEPA
ncbi:MAG: hypothetical protein AB7L84_10390 [Acidimicrobiia bacterium]